MPNTTILEINVPGEANDAPKKFTNIDKEDFEITWDNIKHIIKVGETVTFPKYLVNYAAMHLARKMYKRKMYEAATETERKVGVIRFINAEEEMKLQQEMVKANFPEAQETTTVVKEEKEEIKKRKK